MVDCLRHWHRGDADALAQIYANADEQLLSNIPSDHSVNGARAWIEWVLSAEDEGTAIAYAIVGKDTDQSTAHQESDRVGSPVGNVMASAIEQRHSTARVSYWLTGSARGLGLASSGLRTLVDSAHDTARIYRLELGYRTNNPSSAAVARNAGFLVEGRERERRLHDGTRYDTEVCARLSGDPRHEGRRLRVVDGEDPASHLTSPGLQSPDDGGSTGSR